MTRVALALVVLAVFVPSAFGQLNILRPDLSAYRKFFLEPECGAPKGGAVQVTFLGVTSLLFDDGETQILIDSCYSRRTKLQIGLGGLKTDPDVVDAVLKRARIDRLKAVFVAHSHYDHALDTPYVVNKTGAVLHGSESTLNIGRGGNVGKQQLALYRPNEERKIGQFTVTVIESRHSPAISFINDNLGQTIDEPLKQPARAKAYKEGGSFDFLIRHGNRAILVVPSTNAIKGALRGVEADVVFLGSALLGKQDKKFRDCYYTETVGALKAKPKLVVAIHWDDFFQPLSGKLEPMPNLFDDVAGGFDDLICRTKADGIRFGLMQGFQRVNLFENK